jgi:hypothetical protein
VIPRKPDFVVFNSVACGLRRLIVMHAYDIAEWSRSIDATEDSFHTRPKIKIDFKPADKDECNGVYKICENTKVDLVRNLSVIMLALEFPGILQFANRLRLQQCSAPYRFVLSLKSNEPDSHRSHSPRVVV